MTRIPIGSVERREGGRGLRVEKYCFSVSHSLDKSNE